MPGPRPKPIEQRARQNVKTSRTILPSEGRQGEVPDWPLPGGVKAEKTLWAELWKTPQSVAWERLGWFRTVARYCRLLVAAEKKTATAALLGEVRQLEDRLGLTPLAMLRLEWMIASDEVGEKRDLKVVSAKRPKAIDPDAVEG